MTEYLRDKLSKYLTHAVINTSDGWAVTAVNAVMEDSKLFFFL